MILTTARPFELPNFVLEALSKLGAAQPSKAVTTERLVQQLQLDGIEFAEDSTDMKDGNDLGAYLETQIKMRQSPYVHWAFFVAKTKPTWMGYEWFCNFEPTDNRHPSNRGKAK